MSDAREVVIDYTNWRGERAMRRIVPKEIVFCPQGTEFHIAPGWFLRARDVDKGGMRDFAMADIHSWTSPPVTSQHRVSE
jgi:hypothetical protein